MSNAVARPSNAWVSFAYTNVALAVSMAALGIWFLPVDLWEKGFFVMVEVMLVTSTVIVTKTLRDRDEADLSFSRRAG